MRAPSSAPLIIDRYAIFGEIAAGGMATVHLARLLGPAGFARTVAVKRLLPHLTRDESFSAMLIDEARLAARIRHPNVVSTLDVITTDGELLLVMDYVHGESLSKLWRKLNERGERIPVAIAAAILIDALHGLHAAHEATAEDGSPLNLVHRDVSPQNLLVGADGITRIADFGIAKALGRSQETRDRTVKGKLSYMAPEQIQIAPVSRTTDVFAASIVLWEMLTGTRLFQGDNDAQIVHKVMTAEIPRVSTLAPEVPRDFDAIVSRGLSRLPEDRFPTARDMALAIERCVPAVRASEVGAWLEQIAAESLAKRAQLLATIERGTDANFESAPTLVHGAELATQDINAYGETALQERSAISAPMSWSSGSVDVSAAPRPGTRAVPIQRSISQEVTEPAASRRRRGMLWLVGATAFSVPIMAAVLFVTTRNSNSVDDPVPSAGVSSPSSADAASPQALNPSATAVPLPDPIRAPEPVVSASARKPVSPALPVVTRTPARVVRPAPAPRPPAKAAAQCDPPYSIDAQGRRIFKLECM